jgi:S-DNA-T family DNA segregation ATPase FtsK/SpoIIIE
MSPPTAEASSRVTTPRAESTAEREPLLLEIGGVLLAVLGLLIGSAIVTLAPEASSTGLANVTALTLALGAGAYVFAIFPVAWGIECLKGRPPASWARKAILVPALATLTSMLAALVLRRLPFPGLWRSGPGGYLGIAFGDVFFTHLGRAASLLVLGLWLSTLLLTTDVRLRTLFARVFASRKARAPAEDGAGTAVLDEPEPEAHAEPEVADPAEAEDDLPAPARADADGDDDSDEEDEEAPEALVKSSSRAPKPPRKKVAAKPRPRPMPVRRAGNYEFPPTTLLEHGETVDPAKVKVEIDRNAAVLGATLRSFGIDANVVSQVRGPAITFYELELEAGTRINRITQLDRDLAVALKAENVRVVAPIPIRDSVRLLDLLEEAGDRAARRALPLFLGKDGIGEPIVEDLAEMPHMLIAGATGSGKSVCVNSVLLSVLLTRTPDEVKFVLVDPKQVELSFFEGIPHLLTPVVTNMKKAAQILDWAVGKMEQRYDLFLKAGVRNIAAYNQVGPERLGQLREACGLDTTDAPDLMPYIVIVVDELADLMLQHGKDVETAIIRLAAKSRAVGVHLVLATQRPSVDVITGLIKSNMPMRVSFKVSSMIDSRVILDHKGAEKLLGRGDMLYIPPRSSNLRRAQGTYISDPEVKAIVDFVKAKGGPAEYMDLLGESKKDLGDPMEEDDLYDQAVTAVLATKLGSASMLQRKFGIGYTRASRLIDMMCDHGIVGPHKGSKARELLITLEEWDAKKEAERKAAATRMPPPPDESGPLGNSDEDDGIADKGGSKNAAGISSPWD